MVLKEVLKFECVILKYCASQKKTEKIFGIADDLIGAVGARSDVSQMYRDRFPTPVCRAVLAILWQICDCGRSLSNLKWNEIKKKVEG